MIKDSGARTEFSTGAVRDIKVDNGRCDLMPLNEVDYAIDVGTIGQASNGTVLEFLSRVQSEGTEFAYADCAHAIGAFVGEASTDLYTMMLEVSHHFKEGAAKYGEFNWQKGIPCHSYLDSAVRHYLKWCRGDDDERHDRAFVWNMLCMMWTINNKPELYDIGGHHEDSQKEKD